MFRKTQRGYRGLSPRRQVFWWSPLLRNWKLTSLRRRGNRRWKLKTESRTWKIKTENESWICSFIKICWELGESWQKKVKVLKLKNHFSEKFTRLKVGKKREGHDDAWTHGGIWEFQFESWNVVLAKTQKFCFFDPSATHLSPDAKVAIWMKNWSWKSKTFK